MLQDLIFVDKKLPKPDKYRDDVRVHSWSNEELNATLRLLQQS